MAEYGYTKEDVLDHNAETFQYVKELALSGELKNWTKEDLAKLTFKATYSNKVMLMVSLDFDLLKYVDAVSQINLNEVP